MLEMSKIKNILSGLNQQQQKAVQSVQGPVLIVAGPGSGKTRVLTHRIAYLIQKNIPSENILAVTFTNKAAQEMKERVIRLVRNVGDVGDVGDKQFQQAKSRAKIFGAGRSDLTIPTIGTFHAICLRILRREIDKLNYEKRFTIYDETDQLSLIKQITKDLQMDTSQIKPTALKENISRAKDELISAEFYQNEANEYWPKIVAQVYEKYQKALKKANALDFDDLIMLAVQLFQKYPVILEKYQNQWPYILIDEAHDTNLGQYTLINLLAQKYKNICLIADPDQSIYSWRGADLRNILNFEKDYPDAKVILLEENYRSTQNILSASHHIIIKNRERKEKKIWTKNQTGEPIQIIEAENEEDEGDFIIQEMENLFSQGFNLKDFTVLYRTNAQSRAIEEAFLKANFPYKIIGAMRFYERKEIKDILAYLKLLINPNDLISLNRIINVPPRKIGKTTNHKLQMADYKLNNGAFQNFSRLIDYLRQAGQKLPLTKLINLVIQKTDYEKYIRDGSEDGERRWENIQELFTVTNRHDKTTPFLGLENFLEEITLLSSHDEVENEKDLVNLMTLHCAKGLEFPVVFMTGLEEGLFPHSKSLLDSEQMEEERRLCYVGLTRAKQKVYLSFAKKRRIYGTVMVNLPSRFLGDIPDNLIEFYGAS
jgi:DNA helicase II / ATP-dependent DNA helicase PcrA